MKCQNCQHENPEDARFCNGCGQKLELPCPSCGKVNPPGSRFCNGCGNNLQETEKTPAIDYAEPQSYTPKFLAQLVSLHGFEVASVEADRVNLPLLPRRSRWFERRFAGIGSVLILAAHLRRRVRVEDDSRSDEFPDHKPLALRSIEVNMPR